MSSRRETENRKFRSLTAPRQLDRKAFSNLLARFFPEKISKDPEVIFWARRMYDGVLEAFVTHYNEHRPALQHHHGTRR